MTILLYAVGFFVAIFVLGGWRAELYVLGTFVAMVVFGRLFVETEWWKE